MSDLWTDMISGKLEGRSLSDVWEDLSKVASFRPTVYIGLGGFGCSVIRGLKKRIEDLIPIQEIRDGFAFLVYDTQTRDRNDILTVREYVGQQSMGILPDDVAKDPSRSLGWYRELAHKWEARTILAGANKVRAVGRLAFLYEPTINEFFANLEAALTDVRTFKEKFSIEATPKVYVISSLAGGTGSSVYIDVFAIATEYLRTELGAEFQLQAILVTPEALEGEAKHLDFPDFYANTYSSLNEIFHFISGGEEMVSYGIEMFRRLRLSSSHIPHTLYLLTDRNGDGKIVAETLEDIASFAVSYLLSEIETPLRTETGQPKVQDGENDQFGDPGHGDMPRFLSSLGVVRFGLPYDKVEELSTLSLLHNAVNNELSGSVESNVAENWVKDNSLAEAGSDQLQEKIRKDREGHNIRISIDTEGRVADTKRTELGKRCRELKAETRRAIERQYLPLLEDNSRKILEGDQDLPGAKRDLRERFERMFDEKSLGTALSFLNDVSETLKAHKTALSEELDKNTIKLQKAEEKVDQAIGSVAAAASSGFFGRRARIEASTGALDGDLEAFLNQQMVVWSQEKGINVYDSLISLCEELHTPWGNVRDTLTARRGFIKNRYRDIALELDRLADINRRGPGNRFSLVDAEKAGKLYSNFIDEEAEDAISLRATQEWRSKGIVSDVTSSDEEWISKAQEGILDEVKSRFQTLNLLGVINEFYSDKRERDELFDSVMALGSPLFPLNPSKRESEYSDNYVVAVHPSIRDDFRNMIDEYFRAQAGTSYAYFSSVHEVIIYSISRGYTIHSLARFTAYKAHYDRLEKGYERAVVDGIPRRPIHARPIIDDLVSMQPEEPGEAAAYKWFIVGRAFSELFPTATTEEGKPDRRKNEAFIFNRGSNYYLIMKQDEKRRVTGNSLEAAVENFSDHPEWQIKIRELAEAKIEELGKSYIKERVVDEYVPIIEGELQISERGREYERTKVLRELLKALRRFIEEDLRERRV